MLDARGLLQQLKMFEQRVGKGCLSAEAADELAGFSEKARERISGKETAGADQALAGALLALKRQLGIDVSLRLGFELSEMLIEVRRQIADPAVLFEDVLDFAVAFFAVRSAQEAADGGPPAWLTNRAFPEGYEEVPNRLIAVLESYRLPEDRLKILVEDIRAIEAFAPAFRDGDHSPETLYGFNVAMTQLSMNLFDLQGVWLTRHQVNGVLGMVLFAPPAWLCWSPPAIIVQIIILVLGAIGYGIYKAMQSAAAKRAYKNLWVFVEDCTKTVAQATAQVAIETAGLDAAQKADVKSALQQTLTAVQNGSMTPTGQKGAVVRKLRAMIAAL